MDWFNNLKEDEKDYIKNHPDPSHLVKYLKMEYSFYNAVLRGYKEYILEEIELKEKEEEAIKNKKDNKLL